MRIYEKLKVMRHLKGLSQEELAEKLGCSVNRYAKVERGETDINVAKLEKIAEVMGMDLLQLLGINEKNVFNIIESCTNNVGNIVLTETQCAHELEKSRILIEQKDKEIEYLRQQNADLREMVSLLKRKDENDV